MLETRRTPSSSCPTANGSASSSEAVLWWRTWSSSGRHPTRRALTRPMSVEPGPVAGRWSTYGRYAASDERRRGQLSELSPSSVDFARRRAAAASRLARVTATLALPAAVRGRSAALPAAALDAFEAATFLRWAVLLAVVRFLAAVGMAASAPSSRCAALTLVIRRLLRRAALFGWMMPFSAALSSALMAAATASGPLPSERPSAISDACMTKGFASLRVRRCTARRRSDWRTRLSAEGVRAPFQVRAVLATWGPQLNVSYRHRHARTRRDRLGAESIAADRHVGHSTEGASAATIRQTAVGACTLTPRSITTGDNSAGETSDLPPDVPIRVSNATIDRVRASPRARRP